MEGLDIGEHGQVAVRPDPEVSQVAPAQREGGAEEPRLRGERARKGVVGRHAISLWRHADGAPGARSPR